jgi:hypothetical protein
MAVTVIDNTNLDAIVGDQTLPEMASASGTKPVAAKPEEKPVEPAKEAKEPAEEVEDDNGLTEAQKKELSAKMLTAIGKKHRAMREAEEFGEEQYNQRRAAEKRADQLESEIRRLQAQLSSAAPAQADDKPKRENFETDDAFNDAVVDWKVAQKFREKEAERAKQENEARQAQIIEEARTRVQRAMDIVPDYQEVVEGANLAVPPYIAGYMQESEMFAELGYHFAKHPSVLEKLSKLSPARALVEVGKIESTLQPFAASSAKDPHTEKGEKPEAPSPKNGDKPSTETGSTPSKPRAAVITPLNAGSAVQVDKDEREMDSREALSAWRQKNAKNLMKRARH